MGWGWALIWVWLGGGGGGRLFEAGRLSTFSAFRMGAYSRWALIRGWALIRINTVCTEEGRERANLWGGGMVCTNFWTSSGNIPHYLVLHTLTWWGTPPPLKLHSHFSLPKKATRLQEISNEHVPTHQFLRSFGPSLFEVLSCSLVHISSVC